MEGKEERVDERVAPMVPEERQKAEEEFRPSAYREDRRILSVRATPTETCCKLTVRTRDDQIDLPRIDVMQSDIRTRRRCLSRPEMPSSASI